MKINFISQPYKSQQCGQACLAIATNKAIDQVLEAIGKDWHTDIKQDIQFYLNRNNFKTRLISGKLKRNTDFQRYYVYILLGVFSLYFHILQLRIFHHHLILLVIYL